MGSPTFYWYPGGEGHLEELAIPDDVGVADLQYRPSQVTGNAYSIHGARFTALFSGYDEIVLSLADFDNEVFRRRLEALQRHLQAGFAVSFAIDDAKSWASFAAGIPTQDDTTIVTTGPQWNYNSSAALVNGDEIIIQHAPPHTFKAEPHLIDSITGVGTLNLQTDLVYNYNEAPCLVRHRDFYPILTSVNSGIEAMVTSNRRVVYNFTARLRMSWPAIEAYYDAAGQGDDSVLDVTTNSNGRAPDATLDDVVNHRPNGFYYPDRGPNS